MELIAVTHREALGVASLKWGTVAAWCLFNPGFHRAYESVLRIKEMILKAKAVEEAERRGIEGWDESVFGSLGKDCGTGEVGKVRRYDSKLLLAILAVTDDRYRPKHVQGAQADQGAGSPSVLHYHVHISRAPSPQDTPSLRTVEAEAEERSTDAAPDGQA